MSRFSGKLLVEPDGGSAVAALEEFDTHSSKDASEQNDCSGSSGCSRLAGVMGDDAATGRQRTRINPNP